ncbi:uncharacterized protein LOC122383887 isoform X4 [Amphibalanus amphitrite]|uniref:uncharacterized protein LOC122383887 isoform X4 n=2 Tax=Amphibalanus amphitrite TaxID=1232801 RepID=UPI001C8FAE1E|nr:uncharacterized protein LOC122383887 isoform X4 [Amphibalanus amphitrite]
MCKSLKKAKLLTKVSKTGAYTRGMPEQREAGPDEPQLASGGCWSPQQSHQSVPPMAEGPLDLTMRSMSHQSSTDQRGMDLSLPDKDSPVEACYTCGTPVRRSTLRALLVIGRHRYGDEPFFPSLVDHARPVGSRPMSPDGRVNVCNKCQTSLLHQWDDYQKENRVSAERRKYAVHAASAPLLGEFVCYMCCLTYSVACLSRLRVTPGAAGEHCYPDVLRPVTPPGAEGVRSGAVSVCVNCKRKAVLRQTLQQSRPLPADSHCYRIIEEAVRGQTAEETRPSTFENIRVRRREVVCISCKRTHQRDFMAEVRLESSNQALMHFPRLAHEPRPPGSVVKRSSALVCVQCLRELQKQWEAYDANGTPVANRVYAPRRSSVGSGSDAARDSPPVPSASPPVSLASGSSRSVGSGSPPSGRHSPLAGGRPLPLTDRNSPVAERGSPLTDRLSGPMERARTMSDCRTIDSSSSSSSSGRPKRPSGDASTRAAKRRAPARSDASPKPMSLVAPSTVTAGCYACHQPLEANAAYEVRTEPNQADASAPFFPHLAQQRHLPAPVCSVAVCVFCYHTLADQWARYERLSNKIDPYKREYDTHNFICFVCSVRTYRKRLHVIDVKDFPFLTDSHRYPEGALLICDRTKSVVCRDCHGTLNCQFQDYERWNLPVNKREYNWVARPPPPESPEPRDRPDTVSPGRWTQ